MCTRKCAIQMAFFIHSQQYIGYYFLCPFKKYNIFGLSNVPIIKTALTNGKKWSNIVTLEEVTIKIWNFSRTLFLWWKINKFLYPHALFFYMMEIVLYKYCILLVVKLTIKLKDVQKRRICVNDTSMEWMTLCKWNVVSIKQ